RLVLLFWSITIKGSTKRCIAGLSADRGEPSYIVRSVVDIPIPHPATPPSAESPWRHTTVVPRHSLDGPSVGGYDSGETVAPVRSIGRGPHDHNHSVDSEHQ